MRFLHCLVLCVLFVSTTGLYVYAQGSNQSQETVNALSEQRLAQLELSTRSTTMAVEMLSRELTGLRSSLDRFTGIGIGLGAALTAIQGLLVIITVRNGKKG